MRADPAKARVNIYELLKRLFTNVKKCKKTQAMPCWRLMIT
jgi:hypothetical protein